MTSIDGETIDLAGYRGRVVLMVNVASRCGLTPQYKALQTLYETYRNRGLVILGFPANNFRGQEPGTDAEIKEFCSLNYGVTFPLFSKISVAGDDIHPLYAHLTGRETNPAFAGPIAWNFAKFLVGRDGRAAARYEPKISPDHPDVVAAVERELKKLSPVEELGKRLFFDEKLSSPEGQSRAVCHAPEVGMTGPDAAAAAKVVRAADYAGLFEQVWGNGSLAPEKPADEIYVLVAKSIAAFERSAEANPFSSKFDDFWRAAKKAGKEVGLPRNPDNPFYRMGSEWNWENYAAENRGKHKVPTLRNVDLRPESGFVKAFGHNGFFKSLEDIVHFYNVRDVEPGKWPAPEVPENVNTEEMGQLGLTDEDEAAVVRFLKTLSDRLR